MIAAGRPTASEIEPDALAAAGVRRLVAFAPNWLGDAVMALPALADLKRQAPELSLAVAARRAIAPLFALVEGVHEVVTLDKTSYYGRSPALDGKGFDAALLLPNSFRAAYLAWRAGVRERWGFATDLRGPLLTRRVPLPWPSHQASFYQHLTRALGVPTGPTVPRLQAPDSVRRSAARLLKARGWDGRSPLLALAPGAAYGGAKRWPANSFAAVAEGMASDGLVPTLVGSAADRPAVAELHAALARGVRTLDLTGETSLEELVGVLALSRALVSNDSGAMHVAAALGVPVVAVFGPTDEQVTRPLGPGPREVVTAAVWCRPCLLRECPLDHRCMRGVSPETVLDHVRRRL